MGDDYELRAVVNLVFTPTHLNALRLLETYEMFVGIEYCVDGPPCYWVDVDVLVCRLADQGGYVPTPPNAVIGDQIFTFGAAAYASSIFLNPLAAQSFLQLAENTMGQWSVDIMGGETNLSPIQYAKANNFAGGVLTCSV